MPERYTPPEARGETRDTIDAERVAEQSRVDLSQLLQTIKQPLSKYGKGALFAGLLLGAVSEGVIQDAEAARQVRHTDNASFAGAREEVSIGARMRIERFQGLIQDFEEKIDDANQELARIQRKFAQDRTASQSKKLNATDYASLMLRKKMLRGWIKHYNNRIDTLEGKIEKVKGKHDDRQQERVERQQERGTDRAAERASVGLYKRANAEVDQWLVSANIREVGRDIIGMSAGRHRHFV